MATQARLGIQQSAHEMGRHLQCLFRAAGDSDILDPSMVYYGHKFLVDLADPLVVQKAKEMELFAPFSEALLGEHLKQLMPDFMAKLITAEAQEGEIPLVDPSSIASTSAASTSQQPELLSPTAPPAKRSRSGDSASHPSMMTGIAYTGPSTSVATSRSAQTAGPSEGGSTPSRGRSRRSAASSQAGTSDGGRKRKRKDTTGK